MKKTIVFSAMARKTVSLAALVAALAFAAGPAHGSITFTTVAGSDSDGSVAATVLFTPVNGGLDITLTNTETGSLAKGQAISDFSFMLANGLTVTAFTRVTGLSYSPSSGVAWTTADGLAFSDTSSNNQIDHWGLQVNGGSVDVSLATAGGPVGGNPHYMILPSSGTAGPGESLSNSNFDPYIIGPADFFISVPTLSSISDLTNSSTASSGWDITDVTVSFGTGPDTVPSLDTTGSNSGPVGGPAPPEGGVPEPMSAVIWIVGVGCSALGLMRRRRNKA